MKDSCNIVLSREADILCRYITGKAATEKTMSLYASAFGYKNLNLNGREDRAWSGMMRYPFLIPYVDTGLAIIRPDSAIRSRILVMLTIAETQSEYCERFLGPQTGLLSFLRFLLSGIKAVFYAPAGLIIVKTLFRL